MRRPLARYAITGGMAALVDVAGFWLLAPHAPTLAAAALSFIIAAAVNYRLSASWVFGREWRNLAQAVRFGLFATAGLMVNVGVTAVLAAWIQPPGPWGAIPAKMAGIGVAFLVNFAMSARWVFAANPGARHAFRRPRRPAPH